MELSDTPVACSAEMTVGPVTGVIRCELEDGHAARWHRSDSAGWEWANGQLWPLPPGCAA